MSGMSSRDQWNSLYKCCVEMANERTSLDVQIEIAVLARTLLIMSEEQHSGKGLKRNVNCFYIICQVNFVLKEGFGTAAIFSGARLDREQEI